MLDFNGIHNERSDPVKARTVRPSLRSSTNGPLTGLRNPVAEAPLLVSELLGDQVAQRHVQLAAWPMPPANTPNPMHVPQIRNIECGITLISKNVASQLLTLFAVLRICGRVSR